MKQEGAGHRRDAFTRGGLGRNLMNFMSRTSKHNLDRKIDKRRRREGKEETQKED